MYVFKLLRLIFLFFTLMVLSLAGNAQAQPASDTTDYVYRPLLIDDDFDLSGKMDHPAWQEAPSTILSQQITPNDDRPAPVSAEVKVLYSDTYLYIGFINEDPSPDQIRAHVTERDDFLMSEDYVGIVLDPYNNNQNAYEFFVNPLGIQMDAMRSGNEENFSFDALWYSAAGMTDTGYIAVMKIPYKSLNFPDREIQDWSIQFFRNYPRENRYQLSWSDVRVNNSCLLCQNGVLTGMEDLQQKRAPELLPYALTTQSASLERPGDAGSGLDNGPLEPKVGGSISYAPTSTSSLDLVVNPDFSQVETDASQISINETFALFYEEKRPFFVNEADMFSTRENLYYSRTINQPLGAGKYTRKGNKFSIAFLSAFDRQAPFIVPGREESLSFRSDREAYSNVLRGKMAMGSESHVGGLLTTRHLSDAHNYVGSVDWDLLLGGNYYLRGQLGYSDTHEPEDRELHDDPREFGDTGYSAGFDGERYGGSLVSGAFSREAKYYDFSVNYESFSPTFQSQTGFIDRTDRRQFGMEQSLSYYPDGVVSQGSFAVSGTWRYDFGGAFQERYMFVRSNNDLRGQNSLNVSFLPVNDERFRGRMFRNMHRATVEFRSNTWDAFSFGSRLEAGRDIHRSAEEPVPGTGFSLSADATYKPTPRVRLGLDYSYSRLGDSDGEETYYAGDIYRLKSRYHFSPKLYTRLIAEYDSFTDNFQLYPLLSYKANAFTKFYIGVINYLERYPQSEAGGFRDYRQTSREFFVKFQFLM